jgi:hypothetical protein
MYVTHFKKKIATPMVDGGGREVTVGLILSDPRTRNS